MRNALDWLAFLLLAAVGVPFLMFALLCSPSERDCVERLLRVK